MPTVLGGGVLAGDRRVTPQRQLYKLMRERSTVAGQEPLFMFVDPATGAVKVAARYDVVLGEYIICRTRNVGLQNADYIGGIRCAARRRVHSRPW
jgi:hypothetical protein